MLQLIIGAIAGYALNEYLHKNKKPIKDEPQIKVYGVTIPYFKTRNEAERIIDQLQDYLDKYRNISVHDFYDACGVTSTNYNDDYYIWTGHYVPFEVRRTVNGNYSIWPTSKPKISYKYFKKVSELNVP